MKNIFIYGLLFLLGSSASVAQNTVGKWSLVPHIGVSLATLSKDDFPSTAVDWTTQTKFRSNVAGGVDVEYQSSEACAFSAGLWYREGGARYKDQTILMDETEGTGRAFHDGYVRLNYLALPLMAHVYLAKGLAVNGGLEVAWLIRQKAQYQMQTYTFDAEHKSWREEADLKYSDDSSAPYHKWMLSVPLGLSYEYEHVLLDLRYAFGLTSVFQRSVSDARTHGLVFTMGYRFAL